MKKNIYIYLPSESILPIKYWYISLEALETALISLILVCLECKISCIPTYNTNELINGTLYLVPFAIISL